MVRAEAKALLKVGLEQAWAIVVAGSRVWTVAGAGAGQWTVRGTGVGTCAGLQPGLDSGLWLGLDYRAIVGLRLKGGIMA